MTRAEAAAALDLHKSTVSRAVADKYALLPGGTMVPLSRFFGVSGGGNEKDGVLPVTDAYLPEKPNKDDRPWLAMPIASPLSKALAGAPLAIVVDAVAQVAETLAGLAADHRLAHRDLKPDNLYEFDGRWLELGHLEAQGPSDVNLVLPVRAPRCVQPLRGRLDGSVPRVGPDRQGADRAGR